MQDIVTLKEIIPSETFDVPNTPRFVKGQKVRVNEKLADELVARKVAKYDMDKPAKTAKAKALKNKKEKNKIELIK